MKDFIISGIIALLTADLLNLSNLVYQVIISILLLIIIFLFLRRFDKLANRVEILSIVYCENFIRPLLESFEMEENRKIDGVEIRKFKLIVIIPRNLEEINEIKNKLDEMNKFRLRKKNSESRPFSVSGRFFEDDFLLIFDTPTLWFSGLNFVKLNASLRQKELARLIDKLNKDIRTYANDNIKTEENKNQFKFISFDEFRGFYE